MAEKEELLQAKERDLAETQHQLSQQVNCACELLRVYTVSLSLLTPGD